MLRNDQIQAALVAYLKGRTNITTEVTHEVEGEDVIEVREDQWQGSDFSYPNIRVRLMPSEPFMAENCKYHRFGVAFQAFSQGESSLEVDRIAGIIGNELHERQFSSNSIAFSLRVSSLIPALRSDLYTWRSECVMQGIASG